MEKLAGVTIIGEVIFLNLIYAYRRPVFVHLLPYLWLIATFVYGIAFKESIGFAVFIYVLLGTVLFHFIALKAPPIKKD